MSAAPRSYTALGGAGKVGGSGAFWGGEQEGREQEVGWVDLGGKGPCWMLSPIVLSHSSTFSRKADMDLMKPVSSQKAHE